VEEAAEGAVEEGVGGDGRCEIAVEGPRALRDPRCSQAVLDFLTTTDVGRMFPREGCGRKKQGERDVRGELSGQVEVKRGTYSRS